MDPDGAGLRQRPPGGRQARPRYSRADSPAVDAPVSETVRVPLSASAGPPPGLGDFEGFPGFAFSAMAAAVPLPPYLPPMAGAAPGVFTDVSGAFSWAKTAVFDPIGTVVTGFPSTVVTYAAQAVGGVFAMLGYYAYKYTDALLGSS